VARVMMLNMLSSTNGTLELVYSMLIALIFECAVE